MPETNVVENLLRAIAEALSPYLDVASSGTTDLEGDAFEQAVTGIVEGHLDGDFDYRCESWFENNIDIEDAVNDALGDAGFISKDDLIEAIKAA